MSEVRDSNRRILSVVQGPAPPPPASPEAERARRYRARKAGRDVPKRRPGPKPKPASARAAETRELKRQLADAALREKLLKERLGNLTGTHGSLTIKDASALLLKVLGRHDAEHDSAEAQVLLGDVLAAIEVRHELWMGP